MAGGRAKLGVGGVCAGSSGGGGLGADFGAQGRGKEERLKKHRQPGICAFPPPVGSGFWRDTAAPQWQSDVDS